MTNKFWHLTRTTANGILPLPVECTRMHKKIFFENED